MATPNPFGLETVIGFTVPARGHVSVRIFDALGRDVALLMEGEMGDGRYEVVWEGRDGKGNLVPEGQYYYRIESSERSETGSLQVRR